MPASIGTQTNGFPAFVEPPVYTLSRTSVAEGDATNGWQFTIARPGHSLEAGELGDMPGANAHRAMQAHFPGARYAPQDMRRARKYRGQYPSRIAELSTAPGLAIVGTNDGRRYSIPLGGGRPEPRCGDQVGAFERTDTNGATYSPDYTRAGKTLPVAELAAICAIYDAARVDVPADVKAAQAAIWSRFVPATVEPTEPAPVRRDNVEYHAGRKARRDGSTLADCPYLAGGERAARWTLGWNDSDASERDAEALRETKPAGLCVITGRSVDGTEYLSGMGWSSDRREALVMTASDAAEIVERERRKEGARPGRCPDNGRYGIAAQPYTGPAVTSLAEYDAAEAEADALDSLYGDAEPEPNCSPDEARSLGAQSRACNVPRAANPFPAGTVAHDAWDGGYSDEMASYRAARRAEIADDYGDAAADEY